MTVAPEGETPLALRVGRVPRECQPRTELHEGNCADSRCLGKRLPGARLGAARCCTENEHLDYAENSCFRRTKDVLRGGSHPLEERVMLGKIACAVAVLCFGFAVAVADEMTGVINKIDNDKLTFTEGKKGAEAKQ